MNTPPPKSIFEGVKKYTKTNLKDIPMEDTHGGGMKQLQASPYHVLSSHFEVMTKGILNPGDSYEWHTHQDADEMFIVLQGQGKFYWKEELIDYQEGDVITIPSNTIHKVTAEGDKPSEFYFVRVKV